jgi:hypothetical protein
VQLKFDHLVYFTDKHPMEKVKALKEKGYMPSWAVGMNNGVRIMRYGMLS